MVAKDLVWYFLAPEKCI